MAHKLVGLVQPSGLDEHVQGHQQGFEVLGVLSLRRPNPAKATYKDAMVQPTDAEELHARNKDDRALLAVGLLTALVAGSAWAQGSDSPGFLYAFMTLSFRENVLAATR
jgi:hypothetical protein